MSFLENPEQYAFSLTTLDGEALAITNASNEFETASALKSPIGALALIKAAESRHDIDHYSMRVGEDHVSNGSGKLRFPEHVLDEFLLSDTRAIDGSCIATLGSLVILNIVESDCIATNALIDYVGGKDEVNKGLKARFGLESMRLVSERIRFPGVDHQLTPFQVGASTMSDFTKYYGELVHLDELSTMSIHQREWYQKLHLEPWNARMFGVEQSDLPTSVQWYHKTGTIEDEAVPGTLYASYIDAGILVVGGKTYLAAAAAAFHGATKNGQPLIEQLEAEFANKNLAQLSELGIVIDLQDEAAA